MKIAMLVPGSGGTFYCQNCLRDAALAKALRERGHDAVIAPMYLPLLAQPDTPAGEAPVFFGAINAYLQQKLGLFRHTPRWLDRALDAMPLLRWAARRSASTSARGLEEMTVSMLRGPGGAQAKELRRLVAWLKAEGKPDVVHLSNALLLGLAPTLRRQLGATVVCTLQDEDQWIDTMPPPYPEKVWGLMADQAPAVDAWISVSRWYARKAGGRLGIAPERIRTVYPGISIAAAPVAAAPAADPPTLGYLSRMAPNLGLDRLVESFLRLKARPGLARLRLRAAGGALGDDQEYVAALRARIAAAGCAADVDWVDAGTARARADFVSRLTILSVPVPQGEAFGLYILEALAAGVPVVQPDVAAFREVVEATGGGLLYSPEEAGALDRALESLLLAPEQARALGAAGRAAVERDFAMARMAREYAEVFQEARAEKGNRRT